jgi:outer membrane receptor protein involved in Fe transport
MLCSPPIPSRTPRGTCRRDVRASRFREEIIFMKQQENLMQDIGAQQHQLTSPSDNHKRLSTDNLGGLMQPKRRWMRHAAVASLAIYSLSTGANAQDAGSDSRVIDTVIVTAQKREQNLQDVPIVVTAISEQLLQDTGVRDIKDLTILTPGLIVTSSGNEAFTTARIRGIGTVGDNTGLESSVGVVVDGVYRPRNGVGFGDLGEIERIEVLKGPQSTLFGKNTSAGVINIVSQAPQFSFGSEVEVMGGNFDALEGSASITGPLIDDKLAGRLFVARRERDGFLDVNTGPGPSSAETDGDRSFYTTRGQLLYKPTDDVNVRFIADYSDREEICCGGVQVQYAPNRPATLLPTLNALQPGALPASPDPFERDAFLNRKNEQSIQDRGVSAELNWDLNTLQDATLTFVTAARNFATSNGQDVDFTTADILYRDAGSFSNKFEQVSQELRLAGGTDRYNWLVGVFYADEEVTSRNGIKFGSQYAAYLSGLVGNPAFLSGALTPSLFPVGQGQNDTHEQESKNIALFTNGSLKITDSLEATLGLRYTDESKDVTSRFVNDNDGAGCQALRNTNPSLAQVGGAVSAFAFGCSAANDPIFNDLTTNQSLDEDEFTGTAKLAYRFAERFLTYASYAHGYKASGFNLDRERLNPQNFFNSNIAVDADTGFDAEIVDAYELGAKTQWLGNTLQVNGALFYQDYEDFQLNTFNGIQFIVTSLPQVVSQGAELDVVWVTPIEQLTLQGGVTYAETEIKDITPSGMVNGQALFRPERENDRLSYAPKVSAVLSATFDQPLGNLVARANVGAKYSSSYNTGSNLDPRKIQDAFTLVNARLGIGSDDGRWTVEAFAQNLFDEDYIQVAFDAPLQGSSGGAMPSSTIDAFLGAPRTYGLIARLKF